MLYNILIKHANGDIMKSTVEELEEKTRAYWILSSVWNNRLQDNIPMGDALNVCTSLINRTNYIRPLAYRVWELQEEFIEGTGRAATNVAKILPMKQGVQA